MEQLATFATKGDQFDNTSKKKEKLFPFLTPLSPSSFIKTEAMCLNEIIVYVFTNLCFQWNLGQMLGLVR